MSIEEAMIMRTRPRMVAGHLAAFLEEGASRVGQTVIRARPVGLEPPYRPLGVDTSRSAAPEVVFEESSPPEEWVRLRVWVSPDQEHDWNRSELFLKQLSGLGERVGFEITGNQEEIRVGLLVHRDALSLVATAFRAQFDESELVRDDAAPIGRLGHQEGGSLRFHDYFPPPPYSHLLTCYDELKSTSFASLVQALSQIPPSRTGFYQCLFQPVRPENDWHHNVPARVPGQLARARRPGARLLPPDPRAPGASPCARSSHSPSATRPCSRGPGSARATTPARSKASASPPMCARAAARKRMKAVAPEQWHALLKDHHEGYIDWEQYERNRMQIRSNQRAADGAPREGNSLLQGLVLCGQCGRSMRMMYGRHAGHVHYTCARAQRQTGGRV